MGAIQLQVDDLGKVVLLVVDDLRVGCQYPVDSAAFSRTRAPDQRQAASGRFNLLEPKNIQLARHDPLITILQMCIQRTITKITSDISLPEHDG
ncbi:hypothetical protein D3C71_1359110 [compost metagenome]